jgi:hypothetical protein
MGIIRMEGLGDVSIAGDQPTEHEAQIIQKALERNQTVKNPASEEEEKEFDLISKIRRDRVPLLFRFIPDMVGGVRDATQNILDLLLDDTAGWLESKTPNVGGITWVDEQNKMTLPRYLSGEEYRQHLEILREQGHAADITDVQLPEVAPAKTGAGQLVRTLTQFFVPYLNALKVLGKGRTAVGTAMKMEAGAILTGQAVFDPFDEKLSDLVQSVPALENPVTEYLQADPDDSVAEARFKLALEDAGIGIASVGVVQSIKALNRLRKGQVQEGLSDADEALANMPRTEEPPLPDEVLSNGGKLDPEATASKIDEADVEQTARRLVADQAENIEDAPVSLTPGSQVVKTTGPKYAGNINLDRLEAPDDIKNVIEETAEGFEGLLEGARRGIIKDEQLVQLASDLNMSVKDLLTRRPGELWNAEKILAARQLMLASAVKIRNAAIDASRSGLDTDFLTLKDALNVHVGIQQQVAGLAAEWGRAGRAFRLMPGMSQVKIDESLIAAGGRKNLRQIADMISVLDPNDLANFNKLTKAANDPTMTDKFMEYWINGLLSGPTTHSVNFLSNTLTQLTSIPEK